jgi:hypothetical protein
VVAVVLTKVLHVFAVVVLLVVHHLALLQEQQVFQLLPLQAELLEILALQMVLHQEHILITVLLEKLEYQVGAALAVVLVLEEVQVVRQ